MQGTIENIEDIYELSPMQEGILYHTLESRSAGMYVEQLVCTLRGRVDATLFERAWQLVVDRHPVLRTAFIWEGLDRPMQAVRRSVALRLDQRDWRHLPAADQAASLDALLESDRQTGFALERAPLMRVTLVRLEEDRAQVLWSHHHLLLDGWSVPIILQEVAASYEALARGTLPHFDPRRPYRDYIVWLRSRNPAAAEAVWRKELTAIGAPTPLPLAGPPLGDTAVGSPITIEHRLSPIDTTAVDTFAREHNVTLNTIVLGAWALLLGMYASADAVTFGASVSGRGADLEGSDRMVGLFINSLPVHARLQHQRSVADWLGDLQRRQAVLREHDATPLASIQRWLGLPAGRSLFDTLLVFVNYPTDAGAAVPGSTIAIESMRGMERTSMPLTLFAVPGQQLALKLMSDTSRYDRATLSLLISRVGTIVNNLVADGRRPLGAVPMIGAEEARQLLVEWDAPRQHVPSRATHQLFEVNAATHGDAIAVIHQDQALTYQELNRRANQLAHYLRRNGVQQGDAVALSVDRTTDMVIGALAVLKAGGTYVPIDPGFPSPRIASMLQDSATTTVVTTTTHVQAIPASAAQTITLDLVRQAIAAEPEENLDLGVDTATAAYIVFTSGSTGVPKGAAIPHGALVNLLLFMRQQPGLSADDRMLAIATMSFDLAVLELFLPLVSGAAIAIADRQTAADGSRLQQLLTTARVSVVQGTPSTWRLLLAAGWNGQPRVKMMTGGEPLPRGLAEELLARGSSLWNLYGPTETTIYSTSRLVSGTERRERDAIEPIGRPMPNQPHYILDGAMRPAPIGVTGEVYIGGMGVAHGYVNRPELTAERFVPDPFSRDPGTRLYRSGDLARFQADGVIEFVGRSDFQVKIRGYRVELGEIEAAVEQAPSVRECIVLARSDDAGGLQLVAYVRPASEDGVAVDAIRAALRRRLPEYMVPAAFVVLDQFPRLPNGKPDRKQLPAPGAERPALQVSFAPPTTETERRIASLWQTVLKIDRIGVNDNFFDVGGHSLIAVSLLGRLREEFSREVALVDLFSYPTIRTMAGFLDQPAETAAAAAGSLAGGEDEGRRDRLAAMRGRRRE